MRIIGGKDYYDHAVYYNTDTSRIFKRGRAVSENMVQNDFLDKFPMYAIDDVIGKFHFDSVSVIFCGKLYNGIEVYYRDESYINEVVEFIWSYDRLMKYFDNHNITIPEGNHYGYRYLTKKFIENMIWVYDLNKDNFEYLIKNEIVVAIKPNYSSYYTSNNKLSIWRENGKNWLINTEGLDKVDFYTVFKPHEAYQEIDMFLGTILVNDADNMVQVSNDTKIKKYGFDDFSFKNKIHPSKPRSKRAV